MILKAKERGDAPQLSRYLLARRENDHVELHDVRGFVSDDLFGAFAEADAIARGTRCRNYLFSMSLNPPQKERVGVEAFEKAIARIEQKLGLENQPRAVVFHEKDGRRHAHVVWSRIDSERMRSINVSHYKMKLRDISRELFLEHGWDMPRGLQDRSLRDPLNFTQEEWQQARRAGLDPRETQSRSPAMLEGFRQQGLFRTCPQGTRASGWPKATGAALSPSTIVARSIRSPAMPG